jgi:class 3 adenylate cyclase/tetratricopeptide (TPR) repeat protein
MADRPRRERKVVTVLFADLVGFTSRAETLDPEDVAMLLAPYHARLKSELQRFGGTVEKFIGDAVMALFGAPLTHEDDPERAVRAALAIRAFAEEEQIELRIGISTGDVLIQLAADPAAGETMATGDVVNTAARLQSAAPVNGILVGERTYDATRHAIVYGERPAVEAKGKSAPIPAWEALEARGRVSVDRVHDAPLVGRKREVDLLADALARARQERKPQLATVVGVPGIGKSRLVLELFRLVEQDPELIRWRHGRCLPYGEGITFWALGEMVKAEAGVLESDTAEEAEQKLRAAVEDEWVRAHLRPLIGLGSEVAGDRREAFAAWRRFFETLADEGALVLVFDDLHWADETLLDFVDHLADWATGAPMLIVCTARPELLERRAAWGGGKPNALTISLSPLSDEETARLLGQLLDKPLLEAGTQASLLARAGGNPLYAEQYARMLQERGEHSDLPLPETVQGLIAARLDALSPEDKSLLQDAAVLGKTFALDGLASVSRREAWELDERLHALERKELVRRVRRSGGPTETEYAFAHLLVRDVAYSQIPRSERAARHRLVAEWIESLGRPEDHAEMLAHHYSSALELGQAAGQDVSELTAPARRALRDAGDRAYVLSSFAAALRYYGAALDLWPEADPERPALRLRYGKTLFWSSISTDDEVSAIRDELLAVGDREGAAELEAMLVVMRWHQADAEGVARHLDSAEELVRDAPPSPAKAYVLSQISRYRMLAARNAEAVGVGREALAMAQQFGLDPVRAATLNNIGTARFQMGDPGGLDDLERAIQLATETNSVELCRAYINRAACLSGLGETQRSLESLQLAAAAADRFGDWTSLLFARGQLPGQYRVLGRWDEALTIAEELLAEAPDHYMAGGWTLVRAEIAVARDDVERALEDAAAGLALARRASDPQSLDPGLIGAAFVYLQADRPDEASALLEELLASVEAREASRGVALGRIAELALVGREVGQPERVLAALDKASLDSPYHEAARLFLRGDPVAAAEICAELQELPREALFRLAAAEQLVAAGRRADADQQLRRALALSQQLGATRWVRQGEALLVASA